MATTKTTVRVRLDENLKKDAERVCDNLGLNLSTALRIFYKKVVATGSLPFSLERDTDAPEKEE